jgi:hypothetical protein
MLPISQSGEPGIQADRKQLRPLNFQLWGQPTRLQILWGESPLPSIARFGRLVYPGHGEVTNRGMFGSKSHRC